MKQLLFDCRAEIIALRAERDALLAEVEPVRLMRALLHAEPPKREADRHADVVWQVDLALAELDGKPRPETVDGDPVP
jgi:hypothetical protein